MIIDFGEGEEEVKVLIEFPVLHAGWECDSVGYLVETKNGNKKIATTNHGCFCDGKKELEMKIEEYKRVLEQSIFALDQAD